MLGLVHKSELNQSWKKQVCFALHLHKQIDYFFNKTSLISFRYQHSIDFLMNLWIPPCLSLK